MQLFCKQVTGTLVTNFPFMSVALVYADAVSISTDMKSFFEFDTLTHTYEYAAGGFEAYATGHEFRVSTTLFDAVGVSRHVNTVTSYDIIKSGLVLQYCPTLAIDL